MPRWIFLLGFILLVRSAQANVVGADTQNFNPLTSGLDFVTVHSSETLEPGILNFGYFLNYAVNSLPETRYQTTRQRFDPKDSLLSGDLNFGLGLLKDWDMGVSLPHVIRQHVEDNGVYVASFDQTGLTEVRVNTKYRFVGDNSGGIAGVFTVNFNQIEDNPYLGSQAGPTYTFELALDSTVEDFALGGNLGYRKRSPGSAMPRFPLEPLRDQWIGSLAASYLFASIDTKLIAEVFASAPVKKQEFQSDRDASSAEFLMGAKHDITRQIAVHTGAGLGLVSGMASPDWRVYAGLNWTFGPLFSKPQQEIVRVPAPPVEEDPFAGAPRAAEETFVARDVLFEFNKDVVTKESVPAMAKLIAYLIKPPGFEKLYIDGHTDSVGSNEYNLGLSVRRSNNVKKLIVENFNIPADKIVARGYGESKPIADNGNYQGRSLNRRVEFTILRDKKAFPISAGSQLEEAYPEKQSPKDGSNGGGGSIFQRKAVPVKINRKPAPRGKKVPPKAPKN